MPAIDTNQPALIGGQTAVFIRQDQIGPNVVLYFCKQSSIEVSPFKIDGTPYSAGDIALMGLSGVASDSPVANGSANTDTIYIVMRRGSYKVVHDLKEVLAESTLLGVRPEGLLELQVGLLNEAPTAILSAEVLNVDSVLH